jgi:hypothetical protein
MTPEERYAQHCRRIGIWSRRAIRLINEGRNFIDGDWDRRSILREFKLAYEEGVRHGAAQRSPR